MLESVESVTERIASGERLLLAGSEEALRQLPAGSWIGGTIPYFMAEEGGVVERNRVFVTPLPDEVSAASVACYGIDELPQLVENTPENGFSVVILPAASEVHAGYAENAPSFDGIFMKPIIGWVAGVHLDDLGKLAPRVFRGDQGRSSTDRVVALHCELPAGRLASIGIVNPFQQGDGDTFAFPTKGFSVGSCLVNGEEMRFSQYVAEKKIDTRVPLVANYSGTNVNVSLQSVDEEKRTVELYAPVFPGVEYRFARPVADYVAQFEANLPDDARPVFSCNCILNFVYSELEGRKTGSMTGPITFGEIAYQLLNQTLVYLEIH